MDRIIDYYAVYIDDGRPKCYIAGSPPPQNSIDYKAIDEPTLSGGIYRFITIDGLKVMITAGNIERFSWEPIFKE